MSPGKFCIAAFLTVGTCISSMSAIAAVAVTPAWASSTAATSTLEQVAMRGGVRRSSTIRARNFAGRRGAVRSRTVVRHRTVVRRRGAVRNRNVVRSRTTVVRPYRRWVRRPYYGTVIGGVALGTIIAASTIPAAPARNLCWYWANTSHTRGYWDYC